MGVRPGNNLGEDRKGKDTFTHARYEVVGMTLHPFWWKKR